MIFFFGIHCRTGSSLLELLNRPYFHKKTQWIGECKTEWQCCQLSPTVPDNSGDSRFWTVFPSLQIRVWNLPDIHRSLPLSCRLDFPSINFFKSCLSHFTVNIERFLINFGMVYYAIAMYAIIWNIANSWRSAQRVFLHKWRHIPCDMTSSIIPSQSILNIWRRGGLTALHYGTPI